MDTGKIWFSKSNLFPASLSRETIFELNKMATSFFKKFKFLTWDKLHPKDMKKLINVGKGLNDWKRECHYNFQNRFWKL